MTSHDKPLLAKQLFKLINFEICDKGVKFKQEIHAGVGRDLFVSKNHFITLDSLAISLLIKVFLLFFLKKILRLPIIDRRAPLKQEGRNS